MRHAVWGCRSRYLCCNTRNDTPVALFLISYVHTLTLASAAVTTTERASILSSAIVMADEKHVAENYFDEGNTARDDKDEAVKREEVGLEDEEKRLAELKVVFSSFDTNNNGKIIKSELDAILNAMGQSANDSLLKDIINEVDGDGNGYITFDNFVSMMTDKNIEEITDASEAEAKGAFEVFSERSAGRYISLDGLKHTLATFGHDLTLAQCKKIMEEISSEEDGKITYEELKIFMSKEE
mmetsp:Transcript_5091/g.6734  ORF Transcript_5091/g.6734 Transcript_5091/m.6734 type:complete len:240 (-) Transcript_5091:45-764(-)